MSFIFVAYHPIILDAVKESLNKSGVKHLNLTPYFSEDSEQQKKVIDELRNLPDLFSMDGARDPEHLVVGFLNYQDFASHYKTVAVNQATAFLKFRKFLCLHFEAVLFGELHWKKDVVRKIEEML